MTMYKTKYTLKKKICEWMKKKVLKKNWKKKYMEDILHNGLMEKCEKGYVKIQN